MKFDIKTDRPERRDLMQDRRFNDTGRCVSGQHGAAGWTRRIPDTIGELTFENMDQCPDVPFCAVGFQQRLGDCCLAEDFGSPIRSSIGRHRHNDHLELQS